MTSEKTKINVTSEIRTQVATATTWSTNHYTNATCAKIILFGFMNINDDTDSVPTVPCFQNTEGRDRSHSAVTIKKHSECTTSI